MEDAARNHIVEYLLQKIDELDGIDKELKIKLDNQLANNRTTRYSYKKMLQEVCDHTSKKRVASYNPHKNDDESYDECITCGKHL